MLKSAVARLISAPGEWSAELQFLGTPPNDLAAVSVVDNGGVLLTDDQQLLPFRCVYQPLSAE